MRSAFDDWREIGLQEQEDINYVQELYMRWDRMTEIVEIHHEKQCIADGLSRLWQNVQEKDIATKLGWLAQKTGKGRQ